MLSACESSDNQPMPTLASFPTSTLATNGNDSQLNQIMATRTAIANDSPEVLYTATPPPTSTLSGSTFHDESTSTPPPTSTLAPPRPTSSPTYTPEPDIEPTSTVPPSTTSTERIEDRFGSTPNHSTLEGMTKYDAPSVNFITANGPFSSQTREFFTGGPDSVLSRLDRARSVEEGSYYDSIRRAYNQLFPNGDVDQYLANLTFSWYGAPSTIYLGTDLSIRHGSSGTTPFSLWGIDSEGNPLIGVDTIVLSDYNPGLIYEEIIQSLILNYYLDQYYSGKGPLTKFKPEEIYDEMLEGNVRAGIELVQNLLAGPELDRTQESYYFYTINGNRYDNAQDAFEALKRVLGSPPLNLPMDNRTGLDYIFLNPALDMYLRDEFDINIFDLIGLGRDRQGPNGIIYRLQIEEVTLEELQPNRN
jgi:hypothetical protein